MAKLGIGLIVTFLGTLFLFMSLIFSFTIIEKAVSVILASFIMCFGILIESGKFPGFKEEFDNERKF